MAHHDSNNAPTCFIWAGFMTIILFYIFWGKQITACFFDGEGQVSKEDYRPRRVERSLYIN